MCLMSFGVIGLLGLITNSVNVIILFVDGWK